VLALVNDDVIVVGKLPEALLLASLNQGGDQRRYLLAADPGGENPVESGGPPDRPTAHRLGGGPERDPSGLERCGQEAHAVDPPVPGVVHGCTGPGVLDEKEGFVEEIAAGPGIGLLAESRELGPPRRAQPDAEHSTPPTQVIERHGGPGGSRAGGGPGA
jgi:hypothetical protein